MKRMVLSSIVLLLLTGWLSMAVADDISEHAACPLCGMDRAKFAHSRVYIQYESGPSLGTCSIHCAAIRMAVDLDKMPVSIQVGDYQTKKLIDAENAFWVIGGDKPGVMTMRAKWAFEKKADADRFIQSSGAAPASFDDVLEATFADMYKDTKMIREKRKMMREKMKKQHKKE